jgi:hypothetical protein
MLSTTHNANVANQLTAVDSVATLAANDRAQGGHVSLRTHRFLGKRPSLTGRSQRSLGGSIGAIQRPSIPRPCQPTLCSATQLRDRRESERWLKRSEAGYLPAAVWASLVLHQGHMPNGGMRPIARERRIEAVAC